MFQLKKGLLFQTWEGRELGRALKAFVDNRKGIISKKVAIQSRFKTNDLSILGLAYQVFGDSSARSA